MVFERRTPQLLDSFGRWGSAPGEFGTLHHMGVDSKGNLYVTEVTPLKPENRRLQKFTLLGRWRRQRTSRLSPHETLEPTTCISVSSTVRLMVVRRSCAGSHRSEEYVILGVGLIDGSIVHQLSSR